MSGKGQRAVQVMLGRHECNTPFEEGCVATERPNIRQCPLSFTGFYSVIFLDNKAANCCLAYLTKF